MRAYNPKITDLFDSLSASERDDLRWMLDYGVTIEDAEELLREGANEIAHSGVSNVDSLGLSFTKSELNDLSCFGGGQARNDLDVVLRNLCRPETIERSVRLSAGCLLRDGRFRIVFAQLKDKNAHVVLALAPAGISPTVKIWRYFTQNKAEDLLNRGEIYCSRIDCLTNDPMEGRLPQFARRRRIEAFQREFGNMAEKVVEDLENILRGSAYVSCWTRREHESYLAWKNYCPDDGGFSLQSTWRHVHHIHNELRRADDMIHCRAVSYHDPQVDDLPDHSEGEQLFWKAHCFSDEREVRFAVIRRLSGACRR